MAKHGVPRPLVGLRAFLRDHGLSIVVLALFIMFLGLATLTAGAVGSVWAFETPDAPLVFVIALPLLSAWLLVTLVRLVLALLWEARDEWQDPMAALVSAPKRTPDATMRTESPGADFYQEIPLPAAPGMRWEPKSLWRRKVAIRITMGDQTHRHMVSWRRRRLRKVGSSP